VTNDLSGDQRVDRVCRTLTGMGFRVLLVGRKLPASAPLAEVPYDSRRMRLLLRKGPLFYAEFNIRLFLFLISHRFDLLLSNDLDTLAANRFAGWLRRKPVVYDSHEYFTEVPELVDRPGVKKIWMWLEKRLIPGVAAAYTVSQPIAEAYSQKYGVPFAVVRNLPFPASAGRRADGVPSATSSKETICGEPSPPTSSEETLSVQLSVESSEETLSVQLSVEPSEETLSIQPSARSSEETFSGEQSPATPSEYTLAGVPPSAAPPEETTSWKSSAEGAGLTPGRPVIIYQGALNKGRGLEHAILAMDHLPEAELVIAGSGDLEEELHTLVSGLHLNNVRFAGRLSPDHLWILTRQASLGISVEEDLGLNYRYALPNKLFDYIRARIPVVVSDLPEMRRIVTDYGIGLIAPSRDPETLADIFRKALTDTSLRRQWIQNLDTAARDLHWDNEKEILQEIFRKFSC